MILINENQSIKESASVAHVLRLSDANRHTIGVVIIIIILFVLYVHQKTQFQNFTILKNNSKPRPARKNKQIRRKGVLR